MNLARQLSKRCLFVLTLVVLALVSWTYLATASHNFTDVPDSLGVFHSAVEWMKNRQITGGCTTTEYCPNSPVTRVQMALFMQRLGGVFTLDRGVGASVSTGGGPIDPDAGPIICATPAYTPTFPEFAGYGTDVAILSTGLMNTEVQPVFSIDGGVTWTNFGSPLTSVTGTADAGVWYRMSRGASLNMNPGTSYRFAVKVLRVSGTADGSDFRCRVGVGANNRNPTTSPLQPESWR